MIIIEIVLRLENAVTVSIATKVINSDVGYGLLAAYIGGPAAQADWLGPKVGGHLAPFLYSSREPSELSQCLCSLCCDDSTINIVVIINSRSYCYTV